MSKRGNWYRRGSSGRVLNCREAIRLVQAYLDGELDEVTARRVGAHLEDCHRCGLEAATYTEIKRALARRGAVPPGAVARLRAFSYSLLAEDDAAPGHDADEQHA